jgi:UDP-N-acetylglucosamine:LPS N-acetylglucosamine transferase
MAMAADCPRVLLVCSPGGHLQQMLALAPAWRELEHQWVTLRAPDTEHELADEHVTWAHGPTNRSLSKLAQNAVLARRVLRDFQPDVVLSTGAALAVPFLLGARTARKRAVYVESFTRVHDMSLSGRIVYPFVNDVFVQWPQIAERRPRAHHVGSVL